MTNKTITPARDKGSKKCLRATYTSTCQLPPPIANRKSPPQRLVGAPVHLGGSVIPQHTCHDMGVTRATWPSSAAGREGVRSCLKSSYAHTSMHPKPQRPLLIQAGRHVYSFGCSVDGPHPGSVRRKNPVCIKKRPTGRC